MSQQPLQAPWSLIEHGPNNTEQMYSKVADLYHEFRPRYPDSLLDHAIQSSPRLRDKDPKDIQILELGCGPGTLTLPLAKRGFQITAIDPGIGMIDKARQVCEEFTNVTFHLSTFNDFSSGEQKYDAIVAGSSLHWALAADDDKTKIALKRKLHSSLNDGGSLLLFWNFPPEPRTVDGSNTVSDKVADVLKLPKPFYFGNGSLEDHKQRLQDKVLAPVEKSLLFSKFTAVSEENIEETVTIANYVHFLETLSNYIVMETTEREAFFDTVAKVLQQESGGGDTVTTRRESLLNISFKQ